MKLLVLGSAAGGGFPQWNCNCTQCAGARAYRPGLRARSQSSLALGGPEQWLLVNASPDLRQQVNTNAALRPARGLRDGRIAAVLLSDGQIDHTAGLILMRERGSALPIWCTDAVFDDLTAGNPVLRVLDHFCGTRRHRIDLGAGAFEIPGFSGLRITPVPLRSKPAPFSPRREAPSPGDNLGFVFEGPAGGRRIFYAPGLAEVDARVWEAMSGSDVVLVDGTFWTDDEMIALQISNKTARQMGHLPLSGRGGMLEHLSRLPEHTRRLLIHINNTNPVLDETSPQRRACTSARVEVCHDGLEIEL
jgi:pyrroloquinoline quinone biosynthesis protein B